MAYTVGIKRRWLPGYRKVLVSAHEVQQGWFIFNLADGSQERYPALSIPGLKVYNDFWTHLAQMQRTTMEAPRPAVVPRETQTVVEEAREPAPRVEQPEIELQSRPGDSPEMLEVKRRAAERVRDILASNESH